jgi:hypothetical protein
MNQREINEKRKTKSDLRQKSLSDIRLRINTRMIFGGVLIAASFFSAYLISQSANRMVTVWSAAVDVAPGSILEANDIIETQVLLPNNAEFYLDGRSSIIGSYVLRPLGASELIPAYALSETIATDFRRVPLSIPRSRTPFGIKTGDVVDIYGLPRQELALTSGNASTKSRQILAEVGIDGIDFEASKLGGEMGITLLVPTEEINDFVSAMSNYEFLLVKSR